MLWLNPTDNQGARLLVEDIRAGVGWEPPDRDDADDLIGRAAGRRALLDRSAVILDAPPRTPSQDTIATGFGPLLWLLDRGRDGLPLTQTGALGQMIVREAAARFPGWWDSALFGAPYREAELALLEALHALARRARLLRRRGRRLLLTARARAALREPEALLEAVCAPPDRWRSVRARACRARERGSPRGAPARARRAGRDHPQRGRR